MKALAAFLLASATLANTGHLHAETLKGTQVSGVLFVDGDTTNNKFNDFVTPSSAPATSKIGPHIEFTGASFSLSAGECNYTVNFSAAKVGITDVCVQDTTFGVTDAAAKARFAHDSFEMVFTDPAFAGDMITPIKNGLDLTFDPTVVGDTITFDLTAADSATNKSTFSITPATAVTPEPASWQLLTLGLGGLLSLAYVSRQQSAKASATLPIA